MRLEVTHMATRSYDWNMPEESLLRVHNGIQFLDETLGEGLQCPSVVDPPLEGKLEILHFMEQLGIHGVDLGLPGTGSKAVEDVTRLLAEIRDCKMRVKPSCAGRLLKSDIDGIADISEKAGVVVEAGLFLESSPVRQYAREWTLDQLLKAVGETCTYALTRGLEVMLVSEDATRCHPEALRRLLTAAIASGARRICLCDSVGYATPAGVHALVSYVRGTIRDLRVPVKIDWRGHRDRGLDVINTLAAVEAGVDRIHGTALGIGERVGYTPMESLLINLKLAGVVRNDLTYLPEYVNAVQRHCQVALPQTWPGMGADVFTVVSSSRQQVIHDALERGMPNLAEKLFSSVPPSMVGRQLNLESEPKQ